MNQNKDKSLAASVPPDSKTEVRGEGTAQAQTVSVAVHGFHEVQAYAVGGQIALSLGGYPANLTAYLSAENAAKLADLIVRACRRHDELHITRTTRPNPADSPNSNTKEPL